MKKLIARLFTKRDESRDWAIVRMRALLDKPIGPRYPTGLFQIHDPHNMAVTEWPMLPTIIFSLKKDVDSE